MPLQMHREMEPLKGDEHLRENTKTSLRTRLTVAQRHDEHFVIRSHAR